MAGAGFIKYEWNRLEKGSTIVVKLSTAANVRLMDPSNFTAYKNNRKHRYVGGLVKRTPYNLVVPRTGRYVLTIDLVGLQAIRIRHSATVLPAPLPTAKSAPGPSLRGIRHDPAPIPDDGEGETWDVFISHASEDKAAIAEPLALALQARGLKVFLDKFEMRMGDSLRRRIDYGLTHSTFGVVILSPAFFAKGWAQYELDGIVGMSVNGEQRMLPIWHEISRAEVAQKSPSLADKIARDTASSTVAEIADEIADVIGSAGKV